MDTLLNLIIAIEVVLSTTLMVLTLISPKPINEPKVARFMLFNIIILIAVIGLKLS